MIPTSFDLLLQYLIKKLNKLN